MSSESTPFNPYQPPAAPVADRAAVGGDVEADRNKHIKTETTIRSLGMFYLIGAWVCVAMVVLMLLMLVPAAVTSPAGDRPLLLGMVFGFVLVYGLITWLNFWVGRGLRAFRRGPRMFVLVTSWIGLIGFPIGTVISILLLLLLLGEKGKRVFEADYPSVIAATPHIRYRTPLWIWIVLVGFLALTIQIHSGVR